MDLPPDSFPSRDIAPPGATPTPESGRAADAAATAAPIAYGAVIAAARSFPAPSHLLQGLPQRRGRTLAARAGTAVAALLVGAWAYGLVSFVGAPGTVSVALSRRQSAPSEAHNVASFRYGGEVRASSYFKDVGSQHHPLFLIDGRNDPTLKEKWASDRADRLPWVELRWHEVRSLSHVVIVHAGKHEEDELTVRDYTLSCLRDVGEVVTLEIRGNRDRIARHEFPCIGARGLRLQVDNHPRGSLARLYEIEAIGQ
jgi:pimeloyl-ACP methyl ester carboxylesterase